jgi:hypothetical protein
MDLGFLRDMDNAARVDVTWRGCHARQGYVVLPATMRNLFYWVLVPLLSACSESSSTMSAPGFEGRWNYDLPDRSSGTNLARVSCPAQGSAPALELDIPQIGDLVLTRNGDGTLAGRTDQGCSWTFEDADDEHATFASAQATCENPVIPSLAPTLPASPAPTPTATRCHRATSPNSAASTSHAPDHTPPPPATTTAAPGPSRSTATRLCSTPPAQTCGPLTLDHWALTSDGASAFEIRSGERADCRVLLSVGERFRE